MNEFDDWSWQQGLMFLVAYGLIFSPLIIGCFLG